MVSSAILHVEVRLLSSTNIRLDSVARWVHEWLLNNFVSLSISQEISSFDDSPLLLEHVESISVVEATGSTDRILYLESVQLDIHAYKLHIPTILPASQSSDGSGTAENEDHHPSSRTMELPAQALDGLWELLVFDPDIKMKLLHFISSIILFAEKKVNFMCITWNRLILLHGPPGSGKTSLCRALAQKLSIRLSRRFSDFQLIEINSHSLFSKWFSESGKLVGKKFDEIMQVLENEDAFVVVLIDEVESLTSARKAAASGNEPSDSLRVVNALLTALDKLRLKNNVRGRRVKRSQKDLLIQTCQVIVLTTSNLLEAMDPAFLDRADIKQYVKAPSTGAIYVILRTCLNELIRCGLIEEQTPIPGPEEARINIFSQPDAASSRLWRCASKCSSFSGRTLRRLPVLMHAGYIQRDRCALGEALEALEMVVEDVRRELDIIG